MQVLAHQFEVEALWGGLEQDVDGFAEKSDGARDDGDAGEDRGDRVGAVPASGGDDGGGGKTATEPECVVDDLEECRRAC